MSKILSRQDTNGYDYNEEIQELNNIVSRGYNKNHDLFNWTFNEHVIKHYKETIFDKLESSEIFPECQFVGESIQLEAQKLFTDTKDSIDGKSDFFAQLFFKIRSKLLDSTEAFPVKRFWTYLVDETEDFIKFGKFGKIYQDLLGKDVETSIIHTRVMDKIINIVIKSVLMFLKIDDYNN